jgi:hypothetical protein
MICSEIKEFTVPYLELDLEPARVREVTIHLDGCANCRTEMEAVRQVLVRVKGATVPDPGDRFWSEFPGRVRRELAHARMKGQGEVTPLRQSATARPWLRTSMWPMALAASVLLFFGAWSLKGLVEKGPAPSEQTVAQAPRLQPAPVVPSEPAQLRQQASDLPHLTDAEMEPYWEDDPMVLVEMASRLDRRTVDRLFGDI